MTKQFRNFFQKKFDAQKAPSPENKNRFSNVEPIFCRSISTDFSLIQPFGTTTWLLSFLDDRISGSPLENMFFVILLDISPFPSKPVNKKSTRLVKAECLLK
jgi:hypothetical protein